MRSSLHAHYVHITHLQYGTKITQLELREAAEQRGVYEDLPELDVRRYLYLQNTMQERCSHSCAYLAYYILAANDVSFTGESSVM